MPTSNDMKNGYSLQGAVLLALLATTLLAQSAQALTPDGAGRELYFKRCAQCHEKPTDRAPPRYALGWFPPRAILSALESGLMRQQAAGLTDTERQAIAAFLHSPDLAGMAQPRPEANLCSRAAAPLMIARSDWNGWGRDLRNTRYHPDGGLAARDVPRLELKWAFAYPGGRAYGQPVVVGGRVFLTTGIGLVYALDAASGCTHWTRDVGAPVRGAITIAEVKIGARRRPVVFLGDARGHVQALDAGTGEPLWSQRVDEHPLTLITGTLQFFEDRLYVPVSSGEESAGYDKEFACCSFRGNITALDAASGRQLWKAYTVTEPRRAIRSNAVSGQQIHGPAGGAIWSSPVIDVRRRLVYATTGNSYTDVPTEGSDAIIAFDLATGARRWLHQVVEGDNFLGNCTGEPTGNCPSPVGPDFDFGSPAILERLPRGRSILLASGKTGLVYGFDPDDGGRLLWQTRVAHGGPSGGVLYGSASDGHRLYAPVSDVVVPPGVTPGGLSAVDIATGRLLWRAPPPPAVCSWGTAACSGAQSGAVTVIPGVVFSGSHDGHIRAYDSRSGAIVWDVDTARSYEAVNGVTAQGGSVDGHGQIVAGGALYLNSGGSTIGHKGNALLVFTVDGK